MTLVIIGGGISGLSAAWFAQRSGLDYVLLEASARLGGKVQTEYVGDFVLEAGPDSFLTTKPAALALARDLGLSESLIPINRRKHPTAILCGGRPVEMPEGMSLAVPTNLAAFLRSPVMSIPGKARVLLEPRIPPRTDDSDESLADFIRRRLGSEALDKLAAPLMAGIHNSDPERQSILATFPRYRAIERDSGSLIRGLKGSVRRPATTTATPAPPTFVTLRGGTQMLIDALAARLTGDVRVNARVEQLSRDAQTGAGYQVVLKSGERIAAHAVLITTPAYAAANLVRPFAPDAAEILTGIRYLSSGTLSLAYRAEDVRRPLDGYGLVIPASERHPINAITVSSDKFDSRAPAGHVLLRVFFGGYRSPETLELDDDALITQVRRELSDLLGIDAPPLFSRIYRQYNSNPQADVGHLARMAALEAALPVGLHLSAAGYHGVGLPDCIGNAETTIQKLLSETERVHA